MLSLRFFPPKSDLALCFYKHQQNLFQVPLIKLNRY